MENKGKLSKYLVNLLNVFIILTIINVAASIFLLALNVKFTPAIWVSTIITVIFTAINVYAIGVMVMRDKSINGVWLYMASEIIGVSIMYFMFGYELEMGGGDFLLVFMRIILISLLLLIRKDGKSAWQVLLNK